MKKVCVKILLGIMIMILMLQYNVMVYAANEITDLTNQQRDNKQKINETKEQKNQVSQEKNDVQKQVDELNNQIADYESQIGDLNYKINDLNTQIQDAQNKINEKQENYNKQQELLEKRLVATYEAGETSFLDVLLSSESLTDLISNYYLISEIAEADMNLMQKIENEKKEIEDAKVTLETSKKDLDTSKAEKESKSVQLETAKSEKSKYVSQLSQEEQDLQEEIDQLTRDNQQILNDIRVAQKKYEQQLAELANKKPSNGNTSSSGSTGSSGNSSTGNTGNSSSGSSGSSSNGNTGGSSNSGTSNAGGFIRPVKGGTVTCNGYYSSGKFHGAIDYGVSIGTPIYAAADGVVLTTNSLTTSYGTYVVIQHVNGLQTWYAHGTPGSICVSQGQIVSQGQMIMKSGNSGNSQGPHLHFEVRKAPYTYSYSATKYGDDCRVNPNLYF